LSKCEQIQRIKRQRHLLTTCPTKEAMVGATA
jgi:hypothetical protein